MRPFVPFSEDDRRPAAHGVHGGADGPGHYGELVVYQMPPGDLPDGPGIVAGKIQADENVSVTRPSFGGAARGVLYGNLLLVPIDNAPLYVQPFYVVPEAETRQLP